MVSAKPVTGRFSIEVSEAAAMDSAVEPATSSGWTKVQFESDTQKIIFSINSRVVENKVAHALTV